MIGHSFSGKFCSHIIKKILYCFLLVPLVAISDFQSSIDLVIHNIEATTVEGELAYSVNLLISVLDSAGNPVKGLTQEQFSIFEDGKAVKLDRLQSVDNQPINLMLVMDTSSSMLGEGIVEVRKAADRFVSGLRKDDRVALLDFNSTVTIDLDFTTDLLAAREQLALLNAIPETNTCLYDAAYKAVQMTAAVPPGRRAIVLFTRGVDEISDGHPCSTHTIDDVINLAMDGPTRVPIFSIGVGKSVDSQTLSRMASLTGGRYLYSPKPEQTSALFLLLAEQLRSQFSLYYKSAASPGAHTVSVSVEHLNTHGQDSRNFVLPDFPPRVIFLSPSVNQELQGPSSISVNVYAQAETIGQVVFQIGDEVIGTVKAAPYELMVDFSQYSEGPLTITAIALRPDMTEIARNSVTVSIVPILTSTGTPAAGESTPAAKSEQGLFSSPVFLVGVVISIILLVTPTALVLWRRKQRSSTGSKEDQSLLSKEESDGLDEEDLSAGTSKSAMGLLIVLQSDDRMLINKRFEITKTVTRIGRSAENDIIFAMDSPVSRFHARILRKQGDLYLSEVAAEKKGTTFGTRLNGVLIGSSPALLHDGDEILLGKRTLLRFKIVTEDGSGESSTMDDWKPFSDTGLTTEIN